jgi:hypothetical protein
MAYRMLKPGETGTDAAKIAAQRLQERMDYIRGLMQRLRTAKPASKPAAKQSAPKKAGKKAAKPSRKKAAPAKK